MQPILEAKGFVGHVTALKVHRVYLKTFGAPMTGLSVSEAIFQIAWKLGREDAVEALAFEPDAEVTPAEYSAWTK